MVELSPSLREGREVTSGEGQGQASVSRQQTSNTGLAAALPSLSLDPPGGRVKNDVGRGGVMPPRSGERSYRQMRHCHHIAS